MKSSEFKKKNKKTSSKALANGLPSSVSIKEYSTTNDYHF